MSRGVDFVFHGSKLLVVEPIGLEDVRYRKDDICAKGCSALMVSWCFI